MCPDLLTTRGLYVFEHDSPLGNAHAHDLFDLIQARKTADGAEHFADDQVSEDKSKPPTGVRLFRGVG